ncbi:putative transcriptional regulator protein, LysR family protein [Ketogulonicigenium robustum]|uniref:Putative transcriptional regulator protein, LysR family protein n=1 Tax=Ketogulonicigenium robustum TaxID=92947 RepID=A0A1W6P1D4_9RHOB|nr:LysR family transcriptional regulator [Ketogulonicigenium robustum]ARO15249.1 putative transcriptional regulator protein, LysR family protein [Ketogulonicigenium robustum]
MAGAPLFDLRQLEAYAAVISTGSVTGAARVIGKSQPVVTRLVQDLEAELGFALFARHGRRITPTQNGSLFYREVERLLADASRTRQRAADLAHRQIASIELAATATMAASIVPHALKTLRAQGYSPKEIILRNQTSEEVIQSVAARQADVGIASLPLDHPGLEVQWIAEASCVCVLHEDDPLAAQSVIDLAALAGRQLITLLNPYRILGRISAALADIDVDAVIRTNSSTTALNMVSAGLGVAILEPVSPVGQHFAHTVVRPLSVSIPYYWGIITPIGLPESPIVQPLVEALIAASDMGMPGFRVRDPRDTESIQKNIFNFSEDTL